MPVSAEPRCSGARRRCWRRVHADRRRPRGAVGAGHRRRLAVPRRRRDADARPVADAGDHRRRRGPHRHPEHGRQVSGRHRAARRRPLRRSAEWIFAETQTFGPEVEEFHKTTYQNPPDGGLISQGAAAYRDRDTARRAFDGLVDLVDGCGSTAFGPMFVGDWTPTPIRADPSRQRLRTRLPGEVRRAGRGHVLRVPRLGARHRDDEHPGQGAGLGVRRVIVALPSTSSPSGSGR